MYEIISMFCRVFIALLFLGYLGLAVAIVWMLLGLPVRKTNLADQIERGRFRDGRSLFRCSKGKVISREFFIHTPTGGPCSSRMDGQLK